MRREVSVRGCGSQLGRERVPELLHHLPHELMCIGAAWHGVGFREQVPFEGLCVAIDLANRRRISRRFEKGRGLAESVRLEQLRHLEHRQAFAKGDVNDVHVAARDLVDDFRRRHRTIEAVLAGLQMPPFTGQPQRRSEREQIVNDACVHQPLADRAASGALRDVDELFRARVGAVRLPDAAVDQRGERAGGDEDQ